MAKFAVELVGIDKKFGNVHANKQIDMDVIKGSIHGIIGENGAGKSTLMSILYGFYQADHGQILINGKLVTIKNSQDAIAAGIGMVHQHFMLVDNFTVLENIMLGAEKGALLARGRKAARAEIKRLSFEYGLEIDMEARIDQLSVGLQQRVEILKALYRGAEILILDEPTGVLTPAEADHLFRILQVLRDEGKTILLITHKLREVMAITDKVSVMRRGEMVATCDTSQTHVEELAQLMVGRHVSFQVQKKQAVVGEKILSVQNLTIKDKRGVVMVDDVSFDVRAGEIVGIAGVAGNGQSELLEAIAGMRAPDSGQIFLHDRQVEANPAQLREMGLAHIPEDRHHMGLALAFEEYENAVLGYHRRPEYGGRLLLNLQSLRQKAIQQIAKYDIRPPNPRLKTANFSGGNQQKIIVAREIEQNPGVLIIGQPTRGVDIGAIEFIHRRILDMRDQGKADEIRALSDRILVMFSGRIMGEKTAQVDEQDLGLMMAGIAA